MDRMHRSYPRTNRTGCGYCYYLPLLIFFTLAGISKSDLLVFPEVAEVGQSINLTCTNTANLCARGHVTLRNGTSNLTSSSTSIIEQVQTADQLRVVLRITEPQKLYYFCYCSERNNTEFVTGLKYLQVGYPPAPATNFSCLSSKWEEMVCSWDSQPDGRLKTLWNVTYTVYLSRSRTIAKSLTETLENKTCHIETDKLECKVTPANSLKFKIYAFRVVATNELGKSEAMFEVMNNEAIVKPPPVSNVSVSSTNSSSVLLSWYTGSSGLVGMETIVHTKGLEYKVSYCSQQCHVTKLQHKVIHSKKENVSLMLHDLRPFTVYKATITSRVYILGVPWSEPVSITFTTLEAAPAVAPGVNGGGGFSFVDTMDCNGRGHGVTLYWQGIPEISGFGNGNITSYFIFHNEKLVIEAKRTARETSFCMFERGCHTYKLRGATAAGRGRQTSEIRVTSYSQASALRLRPCEISAMKLTETSVEISWELRSHGPSHGSNTNSGGSGNSSGAKDSGGHVEHHHYVVFWCNSEGRSYCTGDIHWSHVIEPRSSWPHNQTTGRFRLDLPGYADDFRVGISRYSSSNVSGGITWAECLYTADGVKSKVMPPEVSPSDDGRYSVKVKRVQCTLGSAKTSKPVARVLHWCDHSAFSANSCDTSRATQACCRDSTIQSRMLDWCSHDEFIQGSKGGVASWMQHIYPHSDHANSSIAFSESRPRADRVLALDGTWTSAMVGGTIIGALSFVSVSATLIVLLRSYFRSSMNLKKIKKVPAVMDDMLRDEQDDVYGSQGGLYVHHSGKIREIKASDHGLPSVNRSRDRLIGGLDHGGKEGRADDDFLSFGMFADDHGAFPETFSSCQTWTGSHEYGIALPANWSSRDLSSARYIRALTDDSVCRAAAEAATEKLHALNWLPIPTFSKSSCQRETTAAAPSTASDHQNGFTSLSENCGEQATRTTPKQDREKQMAAARCSELGVSMRGRLAALGVSCPVLTSEECAARPSPSQLGTSSQTTASTSCSSLDYWKAATGSGATPLGESASRACVQSTAPLGPHVAVKRVQGDADDESNYLRVNLSTDDRTQGASQTSGAANGKLNLDYI